MGERKVLNKYYPPDFDPERLARFRLPQTKSQRNHQWIVRTMAPFSMRYALPLYSYDNNDNIFWLR